MSIKNIAFNLIKKSMPHIKVKDKGSADLYFEFLPPNERKKFFDDLMSQNEPDINLPNFGQINDNTEIINRINKINKNELTEDTEDFIKSFVEEHKIPPRPYLQYNQQLHKFELKSKNFD